MAASKTGGSSWQVGRNAKTGQLTTVREAQRKPGTHVVETMHRHTPQPKPGKK